jgi:RNA polymerase sigma-70 factor (ECF subfamily)
MVCMAAQPPKSALAMPIWSAIEVGCPSSSDSALAEEVVGFFDQLRDRLLRYVIAFGIPVQDGEDVVQEVFLLLFDHLRRGRSRSNLHAWIFRVAHNLALKRRNQVRAELQPLVGEWAPLADLLPDRNPNPEDQTVSNQKRKRLLAVFNALSEKDQRCLILRSEGLRYRQIAQVLGISLGAVAESVQRSLRRLANAIGR